AAVGVRRAGVRLSDGRATVRLVGERDLPAVAGHFIEPAGTPGNRHVERARLQREGVLSMLAAWEGTIPVGYCIVRWPHPHRDERTPQAARLECAELADLFVAEDRRRRGAGRMLVEAAEALAEGRGACAIGLEVTAANPE